MLRDYTELMQTRDRGMIEYICRKYGMEIAVLSRVDKTEKVFMEIDIWWDLIYDSEYFKVYRRPSGDV